MEKLVINVKIVHILARLAVERQRTVVKGPISMWFGDEGPKVESKNGMDGAWKNKPYPQPLAH